MVSSSWSVEPAKLTSSTWRPCFSKMPRSTATGAAERQIALAFHASFTSRNLPAASTWLPTMPEAPTTPAVPAARSSCRRDQRPAVNPS